MVKLVYCLRRRAGMSREEFQDFWLTKHGPFVCERAAAIGAVRYVQVHTNHDDLNTMLRAARGGPEPYDGIAELWFEDRAALEAAFATEAARLAGAELLADERQFIDLANSPIWLADEHEILAAYPSN